MDELTQTQDELTASPQDWIVAPGEPALHLFEFDEIQPGVAAQLGGHPWAPVGWEWPENENNVPLSLLASIDLFSIQQYQPTPWLPASGMLMFFYDLEGQPWGFDPKEQMGWRVEYFPTDEPVVPHETPIGATETPSTKLGFCIIQTYRDNAPETVDLDEDQFEKLQEFIELRNYQGLPAHQMLGQANPVQNPDMETECQLASHGLYVGNAVAFQSDTGKKLLADPGLSDWSLLLQLDSDEGIGWMWGDMGKLYFWVRRSEAEQGRFDHSWVVLQSH